MTPIEDDPEFIEFAERAMRELVPKIDESACTISLVPTGKTDIKFAIELGLSIMLDKPLIIVVQPNSTVPDHLVRAADAIVEWGPHMQQAIHEALDRVIGAD